LTASDPVASAPRPLRPSTEELPVVLRATVSPP